MNSKQLTAELFKAYFDARRNKRGTKSQLKFEMDLEHNVIVLAREIIEGRYEVGRSICFIVTKPVKRVVLTALGGVMGDYMAQGRSVKLDGIGSFYFTATAEKNGVATAKEVNANLINGVRIRFVPETRFVLQG